jgi:hypothetical protein
MLLRYVDVTTATCYQDTSNGRKIMPDKEVKVEESDNINDPVDMSTPKSQGNKGRRKSKPRKSSGGPTKRSGNFNSNQKSNTMGITPNTMNFKNYCGPIVAQLESNLSYATNGFLLTKSDIPTTLSFSITYDRDELYNQAQVWADQFLQQGNVRFVYLLGRDERQWRTKLIQLYIYSHFKMVILGGNYQVVKERFTDSYMFTGHRIVYEILRTRRFGYEYDPGVYVYYFLDISRIQIDTIKVRMINDFPYLKYTLIEEPGIGTNVISREFENMFSSIKDHTVYPQKVCISSLTEDDSYISSELKSDSIILGNSFLKSDNSGFYYLVSSLQNVTDKSISLSRACFITSTDQNTISKYQFVKYNRSSIFAKHNASAVTGIYIRYEPRDSYNKALFEKPVSYFGIPDPSPDRRKGTESKPINVSVDDKDTISEIISQNSETDIIDQSQTKETQIDFNPTVEFLKNLNLEISGELSPNINILPFDLSSKVDIVNQISPTTLIQLLGVVLKEGARFYMNNYKFTDNGIKTIDDSVSIKFDDSVKGFLIPIKDVFDILTVAWFSKNSGSLFDLKNLQAWLSTKVENKIRYEINKNYVITVYGDLHLSGVERVPPKVVDKGKF